LGDKLLIKYENYRVTEITDLATGVKYIHESLCNRCGICCTLKENITHDFWDEEKKRCWKLEVVEGKKIGEPYATHCAMMRTVDFDPPLRCFLGFFRGQMPKEAKKVCTSRWRKVKPGKTGYANP